MAATYRRNLFELLVLRIPTPPGSTIAANCRFQKTYGESGCAGATVELSGPFQNELQGWPSGLRRCPGSSAPARVSRRPSGPPPFSRDDLAGPARRPGG